jgi:uncharacterized membrane protein YoaK (UPF0700 family)
VAPSRRFSDGEGTAFNTLRVELRGRYVDSCTYLGLFGVFVAQLTGSFVLAGTQFVRSEPGALANIATAVLVHSMRERRYTALACGLRAECLLLMTFLSSSAIGMPFGDPDSPGAIVALLFGMAAMGTQSALVRMLIRGVASTNVMTTNTTLLAINVAEILLGWIERMKVRQSGSPNASHADARRDFVALLLVGLGFLGGTACGAVAYITLGFLCLVLAVLTIGSLTLWFVSRP